MKKAALSALLAMIAGPALADFDAAEWRRRIEVRAPEGCLAAFEIDNAIYAAAKRGLGDLRLVAGGAEVPYTIVCLAERREAAVEVERVEESKGSMTVLTGEAPIPFDTVRIETPAPAFYRHMEISDSLVGEKWRYAGSGAVYRTAGSESLKLTFGERHGARVRVRIYNHDDRPIPITRIVLGRSARRLLFKPRQGQHWLYYGNRRARTPVYDFARTLPACEPVQASLSAPQGNPAYRPPWTEGNRWILYGVLIAAVLALGGVIVRFWSGLRTNTLSC